MNGEVRKIKEEFSKFIKSYGVVSVATGIVMGSAVAKLINVLVEGLAMPIIQLILPGGKWQDAVISLGKADIKIGLIIAAIADFFVIALVIFLFVRYILKMETPNK
jgi:large conductance mechanosensitive channel